MARLADFIDRYRITNGKDFRLKDYDPAETHGVKSKLKAEELLRAGVERLSDMQDKLYAQDRWAVLVVIQAMDAAGKDGLIKHVMSGVNPQGCQVTSFKIPSSEELDHDFLWRTTKALPERGRIGIFNRSHYEEVLVVRVHPELLDRQRLPKPLIGNDLWQQRFDDICAFERHIARNGTRILKSFLHVSSEQQLNRFLARIDEPGKRWKFSMADVAERKFWDKYQLAYEDMIRNTSRPEAPWFVVPADHKWFTRMIVAGALVQELQALNLDFPKVEGKALEELQKVANALKAEKS